MATLTGQKIQDSYKTLLKTESASGFNSETPTRIEDGDGNQSALYLGKTKASVVGSLSLNLSTVSSPRANLHIIGTQAQSMLIQNTSGYNKFYVGDYLGGYNVKVGDIDSASPGNNTFLYVQDSSAQITSKSTYFGVNQTAPSATLHVGSNSGTALFSMGSGTEIFKVTSPTNTSLFSMDATNDKVTVNADVEIKGNLRRSSEKYYLEEFFDRRPSINEDLDDTDTEAEFIPANKHFEVKGTNKTSALVDWGGAYAGIRLTTAGANNDQIIILPHLNQLRDSQYDTAWAGILWGTENQVEWECAITTDSSVADYSFWAGLKLTEVPAYADDDDKAYFLFCSDDDHGALTTNANLHFVYSVGGTDYITDLGLAVAVSTTYRLRIEIDSDRKVSVFVNDTQYGLVTSATAGGATQSVSTTKSNTLTDNIDLIPYVGVQQMAGGKSSNLRLHYEKISRILFE